MPKIIISANNNRIELNPNSPHEFLLLNEPFEVLNSFISDQNSFSDYLYNDILVKGDDVYILSGTYYRKLDIPKIIKKTNLYTSYYDTFEVDNGPRDHISQKLYDNYGKTNYQLFLDINGNIWGWGENFGYYLGDGTDDKKNILFKVYGNQTFSNIFNSSFNYPITLAIDSNNDAWVWPWFSSYPVYPNNTPIKINSNNNYCDISVGYNNAILKSTDHKSWAWGNNYYGQLGDNSVISRCTPVAVHGNHTFCKIYNYSQLCLAIDNNNKAWGWGFNHNSQLGVGNQNLYSTPVAIHGNICFNEIYFTAYNDINNVSYFIIENLLILGLDVNGQLWSWGDYNEWYQGYNSSSTPKKLFENKLFQEIHPYIITTSYEDSSFFAKDFDGNMWSWGNNTYGNLGDNTTTSRSTPVRVCGNHTFNHIYKSNSIYGVDNHKKLWKWGGSPYNPSNITPVKIYDNYGEIENVNVENGIIYNNINEFYRIGSFNQIKNNPVVTISNQQYDKIHYGYLEKDNVFYSWGYNRYGELGDGGTTYYQSIPTTLYGNHSFVYISKKPRVSIAIDNNNDMWWWSRYTGNPEPFYYIKTPTKINGNKHTFCKIIHDQYHIIALDNNNKAWSWGNQAVFSGQGGNNSASIYTCTPIAVCGNHTFNEISGSYDSILAIDNLGKAWAWGKNNTGQLGINSVVNRSTPYAIYGNHTFCQIFIYNRNYYPSNYCSDSSGKSGAIDNNNKPWMWGINVWGALGNNSTINKSTPVAIHGNHTFCKIIIYYRYCIGMDNNGKTWAWGNNEYGQLGNNSNINKSTPVQVYGNHTFCKIVVNMDTNMAIDNHNKLWGWGYNMFNNIGNNMMFDTRSTPIAILSNKNICDINLLYTGSYSGSVYYKNLDYLYQFIVMDEDGYVYNFTNFYNNSYITGTTLSVLYDSYNYTTPVKIF